MGTSSAQVPPYPCASVSGQKRKWDESMKNPATATHGVPPLGPATPDDRRPPTRSGTSLKKTKKDNFPAEKRLRRFRPHPPSSFYDIYSRATTQRFYVLKRTRCGTPESPEESVELAGSTGNVYTVVIARGPACDCPHALKGNQCKHVLYVLSRVLRASFHYVYQLALLSEELRDIFAHAPLPAGDDDDDDNDDNHNNQNDKDECQDDNLDTNRHRQGGNKKGRDNRKPVEGDCPICFEELAPSGEPGEALVWCKAACGQNVHKNCFEMWAGTRRRQGSDNGNVVGPEVTCPLCRCVWQGDEDMVKKIKMTGPVNEEGYVNVADQLGMSTIRDGIAYYPRIDTSSYSSWYSYPSRRRRGYGYFR